MIVKRIWDSLSHGRSVDIPLFVNPAAPILPGNYLTLGMQYTDSKKRKYMVKAMGKKRKGCLWADWTEVEEDMDYVICERMDSESCERYAIERLTAADLVLTKKIRRL